MPSGRRPIWQQRNNDSHAHDKGRYVFPVPNVYLKVYLTGNLDTRK
jgi:hypothetical protein